MNERERILIVDGDAPQAAALARILGREGYRTQVADGGGAALAALRNAPVDLVLTGPGMVGTDGVELFRTLRAQQPDLPVLITTAPGSIAIAIDAVGEGVADFVQAPVQPAELIHRLGRVLRERRLRGENAALRNRLAHRERGDAMLGTSAPMEALRHEIARVAGTDATVLVLGERGVGKELVADAIHHASGRAGGPLVKLHCAALPETLNGEEPFGPERAASAGGTLYLDGIGELPPGLQAKLLRLLAERNVPRSNAAGVRVVCATHEDLAARVAQGRFREDLYQRLQEAPIPVPPLRERGDDVVLLARAFAREAGARHGRPIEEIEPGAIEGLRAHDWPGNVRELRNAVERAVLLGNGPRLAAEELQPPPAAPAPHGNGRGEAGALVARLLNSEIAFDEFEKEILVRALRRTRGNQTRAARLLGMTRRTLQYRIDKFDIDCEPMRDT